MGRNARYRLTDIPQLLHQRGHNRLPCFLDGSDYQFFSQLVRESAEQFECHLQAILQLPDAYWVVMTPTSEDGLQRAIQRTGRLYVRHINGKYRREGTLWAGRYNACAIEPTHSYLAEISRYLQDLPVKRGMSAPETRWPWYATDLPPPALEADSGVIEKVLRSGLVYGSEEFCEDIARQSGLPTIAGRRGRPAKRQSAV